MGDVPEDLTDHIIYEQTTQRVSDRRSMGEAGEIDSDEKNLKEAVYEAKRRRIDLGPEHAFRDAQKVFTEVDPAQFVLLQATGQNQPEFNGLDLDLQLLGLGPEFKGVHDGAMLSLANARRSYGAPAPTYPQPRAPNFRLLESTFSSFWLMIEITKHLRVQDLVRLYSVSRTFHGLVNSRFQSTITAWAQHMSPAGWKVFFWKFYGKYTIQDPAGTTWAAPGPVAFPRPAWDVKPRLASNKNVRRVPSLKYLAMLEQRETRVRDILACLARSGHRLPKTAHITLKKIWLLMDCATNAQRRGFIHNPDLWPNQDLYNAQMFFVKLQMRFNEPIFGPNSPLLADTFLGAKDGLTPLWKLLRRKAYTDPVEVIQQRLRYWAPAEDIDHWRLIGGSGQAYWNVPPGELGEEHREGWGAGHLHLMRPDELVVEECVRREIAMQEHIIFMLFWGHVDFQRRRNLIPSEEEMYMSDEDEPPLPTCGPFSRTGTFGRCGNVPFAYYDWQPKHAMKARWKTLTRTEKLWIVKDDHREQEDALVWEEDGDGFWNDFNVNDYPDPGEEDRQEALRQNKPHLTDFERKVLAKLREAKARGDEVDYADIISLSGSSDSFFDPVIPTDEPELDLEYRTAMEEEAHQSQEEDEPVRDEESGQSVYEDEGIPPIPDSVTDPVTIAHWNEMDPYLHQVVIQEHKRQEQQQQKAQRELRFLGRQAERKTPPGADVPTATTPHRYHYDYPSIQDPHLLAMLRQYDCFPPEAFGDQFPPSPEKKPHEDDMSKEDWEDADDEGLQALADVDYDSDESDFDVDMYQKFLDRVGGCGGIRQKAIGETEDECGASDEEKLKGKDKRRPHHHDDDDDEEDNGMMETAHEADVLGDDDDIPFPTYEFRQF